MWGTEFAFALQPDVDSSDGRAVYSTIDQGVLVLRLCLHKVFDFSFWINVVSSFDTTCRRGSYNEPQLITVRVRYRTNKTKATSFLFVLDYVFCLGHTM